MYRTPFECETALRLHDRGQACDVEALAQGLQRAAEEAAQEAADAKADAEALEAELAEAKDTVPETSEQAEILALCILTHCRDHLEVVAADLNEAGQKYQWTPVHVSALEALAIEAPVVLQRFQVGARANLADTARAATVATVWRWIQLGITGGAIRAATPAEIRENNDARLALLATKAAKRTGKR